MEMLLALPLAMPAVVLGVVMVLGTELLAIPSVMVTLFLAGPSQTLPIWVFNQMRFGFTPSVNAVFTILGFFCLSTVVAASLIATLGLKKRGS